MVYLCPVICRLLPLGDGEVLCARAQDVLDKHPIFAVLPSVQALHCPPSDSMGYGDMLVSLQYHLLEDDEPLRVPLSVPHPPHLSPKRLNETSPNFPARRVITPIWHDHEVTPPILPRRVVADAAFYMGARVTVNPFSVDLL